MLPYFVEQKGRNRLKNHSMSCVDIPGPADNAFFSQFQPRVQDRRKNDLESASEGFHSDGIAAQTRSSPCPGVVSATRRERFGMEAALKRPFLMVAFTTAKYPKHEEPLVWGPGGNIIDDHLCRGLTMVIDLLDYTPALLEEDSAL